MQNKGFTLVELIVVITILAILGTIAFISLQGYGAEAKNSKVTSDLRNLVSAIETKRTRDSAVTLGSLITNNPKTANDISATARVAGSSTASGVVVAGSGATYDVWNIDFSALGQNGDDFTDPNSGLNTAPDYLYAYVSGTNGNTNESFGYYQLAGQLIENDVRKVRINGNYVQWESGAGGDTLGLISQGTNATGSGTALVNDATLTAASTSVVSSIY